MNFEKLLIKSTGKLCTFSDVNGKCIRVKTANHTYEGIVDMPVVYEIDDSDPNNPQCKQMKYTRIYLRSAPLYTPVRNYYDKNFSISDDEIQSAELLS